MESAQSQENTEGIVPEHKGDEQAVKNLRHATEAQILANRDELLSWTQDGNWPVAYGVGKALAKHLPAIREDVLRILRGSDGLWKYFFMGLVIGRARVSSIDEEIRQELRRIARQPTPNEQAEEADQRAQSLLEELGF
ncbi:DUF5071 domain-containing protein [Hymenobacter sp. CRA2]|uniref:DUF5071 domain-containing protein n=1 Tax=Hymenobacter sp. CRA2 TaxID=1955620 RepID=UPI00098FFB39|nr:DUF5071 domain-containing protein [Hymenobacter sp. CRA2]OON67095.1 hypothetical protein B0919_19905 [Hymenobacter sp. CRA2]